MSVIELQIKKLIAQESIRALKSGRLVDISDIAKLVADRVRRLNGGPTLINRRWEKRSRPDIVAYNKMIEEIKFDL